MIDRVQLLSILGSIVLFAFIVELVRRRRLKVEYSILWLTASAVVLVLSVARSLLERFARLVGVYYAPAALFLVALFFGILLFIHFSVVISRLSGENTSLAQRIALLESEIEEARGERGGTGTDGDT